MSVRCFCDFAMFSLFTVSDDLESWFVCVCEAGLIGSSSVLGVRVRVLCAYRGIDLRCGFVLFFAVCVSLGF